MQYHWFIEELRRKIKAVLADKGSSVTPIDQLEEYIGMRMTSDSALFCAMKVREAGGTTEEMLAAAFHGAFGMPAKRTMVDTLNAEGNSLPPTESLHDGGRSNKLHRRYVGNDS